MAQTAHLTSVLKEKKTVLNNAYIYRRKTGGWLSQKMYVITEVNVVKFREFNCMLRIKVRLAPKIATPNPKGKYVVAFLNLFAKQFVIPYV